jgi:hypothetical protein
MVRMNTVYYALGRVMDRQANFEGISAEETVLEAPDVRSHVHQLKRIASAMPKASPN